MKAPEEVLIYLERRINENSQTRQEYKSKLTIVDCVIRGMNQKYKELKLQGDIKEAMKTVECATSWIRNIINSKPDEKHK